MQWYLDQAEVHNHRKLRECYGVLPVLIERRATEPDYDTYIHAATRLGGGLFAPLHAQTRIQPTMVRYRMTH